MGYQWCSGCFLISRCRASLSWAVHEPWQSAMFPVCRPVTHTNVNKPVVCRNINCASILSKRLGSKLPVSNLSKHRNPTFLITHSAFPLFIHLPYLSPLSVQFYFFVPVRSALSRKSPPTAFNEVTLTFPCRRTVESNSPVPPLAQCPSCFPSQDTLRSMMRDSAFVMFELQGRVSLNQDAVPLHILCGNPLFFDPTPFHGPNRELWSQNFSRLHQAESPGCILYRLSNAHADLTWAHTCFWIPISTGGDLKSLIVMYIAWKHMEKIQNYDSVRMKEISDEPISPQRWKLQMCGKVRVSWFTMLWSCEWCCFEPSSGRLWIPTFLVIQTVLP